MFTFRMLICVVFMFLAFTDSIFAGPNANVTISLDLIPDGGPGNQVDDGITSDTVSERGTIIAFEVFAKGVTTPLTDVIIEFGFDSSVLRYNKPFGVVKSDNEAFDTISVPEHREGRIIGLSRGTSSGIINSSGFLTRVEFTTVTDIKDTEFRFILKRVLLSEHGIDGNNPYDNIVPLDVIAVTFNSSTPTPVLNGPGPNANATISLDLINISDLITANVAGNQIDDGVTSGINPGGGQRFMIEVFVRGVTTPLTSARIVFDYDSSFLGLGYVGNRELFPIIDREYSGVTLRTDVPATLSDSGYLLKAEFNVANEKEIRVGVKLLTLTSASGEQDIITTTDVILLKLASSVPLPPPPFTLPSPPSIPTQSPVTPKNILPGDLNGDGAVNIVDFLILTNNFGRTDGDTFDPTRLIEGGATSGILVTLPRPRITVLSGDWGKIPMATVRVLFDRVRDVFADRLAYPTDSNIIVEPVDPFVGPSVSHARERDGSYLVKIARSADSAGLIFQFAHEYGHILSNYREAYSPLLQQHFWFDESIASLASLFAYRMIPELESVFHAKIKNIRVTENGFGGFAPTRSNPRSLTRWYQNNKILLESNSRNFDKNEVVALMLFDIFEQYPNDAWNAVRYMNRGALRHADSFSNYLNRWYRCTPPQWQFIVEHVMYRFGIPHIDGPFLTDPSHQSRAAY